MSCGETHNAECCNRGNGFVVIVVLYVLLAIILGSALVY